jgi:hypothetical protein
MSQLKIKLLIFIAFDSLSPVRVKKSFLLFITYRTSIAGKPAVSLNMADVHATKILVPVYQATRRHNPEDHNLTISLMCT